MFRSEIGLWLRHLQGVNLRINKLKEHDKLYIFKNQRSEIWNENKLISNTMKKIVNEKELKSLISKIDIIFLINTERNYLNVIENNYFINNWDSTFKNHIADSELIDLDEYDNGYCFAVEQWVIVDNRKLIVLYYYH